MRTGGGRPMNPVTTPGQAVASAPDSTWHRASLWLRAEQLWRQGQPASDPGTVAAWQDMAQALQTWLSAHPSDGLLWDALGRIHTGLGQTPRAQRARAEALVTQGDVDAALLQLRQAQSATRTAQGADLIEASVIDARVRQLVALRQRWADDLRSLR